MRMVSDRNSNLEILRFLAAFGVLMTHVGEIGGIDQYTAVGGTCVKLFFILSGYLIFASLESSQNLKIYYKKRITSIIPLYWSFLVLASLIDIGMILLSGTPIPDLFAFPNGKYGVRFLTYFLGVQMFLPSSDWALWNNRWNLWSISAFVLFYILAPLLYKLFKSFKVGFIFLFCILLITRDFNVLFIKFYEKIPSLFTNETHIEWYASMNPYSEMYCFLLGTTLYLAYKEKKEFHYLFLISCMLIFKNFTWFSHDLAYTLLIGMMLSAPPLLKNNKLKNLVSYLGKGSFALYLWHPFAITLVGLVPISGLPKMCLIILVAFIISYGIYEVTTCLMAYFRIKRTLAAKHVDG